MFVDASAIIAILASEPEGEALAHALSSSSLRLTSALAVWEAVIGLVKNKQGTSVSDARRVVQSFVDRTGIRMVTIGPEECDAALMAFERFGKGRHPARLNLADCFAYACARTQAAPLLFKGDDFAQTDIPVA